MDRNLYPLRYPVLGCLLLLAVISVPFDVRLAQFFMQGHTPGELRSLIHKSEFFGHAYGILGIAVTMYLLDETRRRYLPRLLAAAFSAGIVCDVVKIMIPRIRPREFSFASGESTFLGLSFLHVDSVREIYESSSHSFPSAHTGTAVAFAMVLGCIYTKAARWFIVLAVLVALSRVDGCAHYLSDTCVGAVIGYVTACCYLGHGVVGQWFERLEKRKSPLVFRLRFSDRQAA